MKKNVGTRDALLRITFGLAGLAWAMTRMIRHPYRSGPVVIALLSAMKVAEGITRYCPMLACLGMNTLDEPEKYRRPVARKMEGRRGNERERKESEVHFQ